MSICYIFSKKLKGIILITSILSFIFIIFNLNFHPHFKDFKVIESSSSHEGLVIEREYECKNKICTKNFKMQPRFVEIISNFKESAYVE